MLEKLQCIVNSVNALLCVLVTFVSLFQPRRTLDPIWVWFLERFSSHIRISGSFSSLLAHYYSLFFYGNLFMLSSSGQSVHLCHVQLQREEGRTCGASPTGWIYCGLHWPSARYRISNQSISALLCFMHSTFSQSTIQKKKKATRRDHSFPGWKWLFFSVDGCKLQSL